MVWTQVLLARVEQAAQEAGFDVSGVCRADAVENKDRFTAWVEEGRAGEMEWLKRRDEDGALLRSSLQIAMPWARSIVVCAMNYHVDAPRSLDDAPNGSGWIGRYALSGRMADGQTVPVDYHDDMLVRLRRVEAELLRHDSGTMRCYVDTGPLVERVAAVQAGIGWVGKNTCILREGLGSWLLLGVIVTSLEVDDETPVAALAADRCGSCTRCLDACPTGALVAPREMDASLCIAYLTIEKKGEIAEDLREPMGRQIFGCDICQDVCPWNRRAPIASRRDLATRLDLVNPSLAELAKLDAAGFKRLFRGSPLERTGRKRLMRNLAIAMANSGDSSFLSQLEDWITSPDAALASTALWAAGRLRGAQEDYMLHAVADPCIDQQSTDC